MNIEEKKTAITEKARDVESTKETPGFIYLTDRLAQAKAEHDLSLATDWSDYKYRLGVLKGLSLLEELADMTIQQADRVRRGKRVF